MISERITAAREWVRRERERNREYVRFYELFPAIPHINGVLTLPGDEIHPLRRGLIVSPNFYSTGKNLLKGKNFTDTEVTDIHNASLNAIGGNYETSIEDERLSVKVTLDTPDATSYLTDNKNGSIAFLSHRDLKYKYGRDRESSGIEVEGGSLTYSFEGLSQVPDKMHLYIYTRPLDTARENPRFTRLGLVLLSAQNGNHTV